MGLRYDTKSIAAFSCSAVNGCGVRPVTWTVPFSTLSETAASTTGRKKKPPFFSAGFSPSCGGGWGGGTSETAATGCLSVTRPKFSVPTGNRRSRPRSNVISSILTFTPWASST